MSASFPNLFSPLEVGSIEIKNRIFSTGHMTLLLDGGAPSDDMVAYHQARAAGGAGLIVTEASAVHPSTAPWHIYSFSDDCIPGYRRIAAAVQPHGCKVFGQLGHSGAHNYTSLGWHPTGRLQALRAAARVVAQHAARHVAGRESRRSWAALRRSRRAHGGGRARRCRDSGQPQSCCRRSFSTRAATCARTNMAAARRTGCAFCAR